MTAVFSFIDRSLLRLICLGLLLSPSSTVTLFTLVFTLLLL